MSKDTEDSRDEFVLSYHRVRQALGLLGLVFPLALILGGLMSNHKIEPSISDFYHTALRDVFVGSLCAIGIFLISYKGYRRQKGEWVSDDIVATLAGLAAFGVAFFPNESPSHQAVTLSQLAVGIGISPLFHYTSALTFFVCLAIFCYVKFPKTAKPVRRRIYIWCGHVIAVCTVMIFICSYLKLRGAPPLREQVLGWHLIFWFEAIGVWAFALSWLTKGKADLALSQRRKRAKPRTADDGAVS